MDVRVLYWDITNETIDNIISENSCRTPDNFGGKCVNAENCLIFKGGHQRNAAFINYLEHSKCGNSDVNIILISNFDIPKRSNKYYLQQLVCCRPRYITRVQGQSTSATNRDTELNAINCGVNVQDKVSHGNITSIGEFPFMALLGYRSENGVTLFKCGGSLITPRYVLTAAHCITNTL